MEGEVRPGPNQQHRKCALEGFARGSQLSRILLSFASHTAPAIDQRTPKQETHNNRVLLSEACAKV